MALERGWAYGISALIFVAVAWPAFRSPGVDDFPLSTYPMFSHGRRSPKAKIVHVVGFWTDGGRLVPPPNMVASEEVMQTLVSTQRAVKAGRAFELCREVAARVAEEGEPWSRLDEVQVRTDWYDAVRYFAESREPKRTKVHARCPVPRD